jgi:hypothetical protein
MDYGLLWGFIEERYRDLECVPFRCLRTFMDTDKRHPGLSVSNMQYISLHLIYACRKNNFMKTRHVLLKGNVEVSRFYYVHTFHLEIAIHHSRI